MRQQIGTVKITRARVYNLDPDASAGRIHVPASAWVEPGEYPVYQDGMTRYWRMTGRLNRGPEINFSRIGDGMFSVSTTGDDPSDEHVEVDSRRLGPDEWEEMIGEFRRDPNPALVFKLTSPAARWTRRRGSARRISRQPETGC